MYRLLFLGSILTIVAVTEAGVMRFRAPFEDAFVALALIGLYTVLAALAAGLQREHRQPVADVHARHLAADLDHLAGVFVAEHHAHRDAEDRVL